jgi:hypothetical protein
LNGAGLDKWCQDKVSGVRAFFGLKGSGTTFLPTPILTIDKSLSGMTLWHTQPQEKGSVGACSVGAQPYLAGILCAFFWITSMIPYFSF